jgi:hypothetical protein
MGRVFAGSVLLSFLTFAPLSVQAASLVLDFTDVFSGTTGPASPPPWVEALFADVSPGTVRLTVTNLSLTGNESVGSLYFNLKPDLDPTSLSFTFVSKSGAFLLPTISKGADAYKADGDGFFDIQFGFSQGNQSDRFTAGQSLQYDISGIGGLMASDFAYISASGGGSGTYYGAAHIQQTGVSGQDSAWIAASQVPEPAAFELFGLGISVFLVRRRQR